MNNDSSSVKIKDDKISIQIENDDNINNSNKNNIEVNDFGLIRDQNDINSIIENADKVSINSSSDSILHLINNNNENLFEKYKCFYKEIKNLIISKEEKKKFENFDYNKQLENEKKYIIKKINNLISEHNKNKLKKKLIKSSEQRIFIKGEITNCNDINNLYEKEINLLRKFIKNNFKNKNQGNKIENENKNKIKINLDNLNNNSTNDNNYNIKEDKIKLKKKIKNEKNTSNILPELISPKAMYNIFIHCIKQFEYEKKIYDKFLTHDDYLALKAFIPKIKDYITQVYLSSSKFIYKSERKVKNITYNFK